jgi:hypothetical protein
MMSRLVLVARHALRKKDAANVKKLSQMNHIVLPT